MLGGPVHMAARVGTRANSSLVVAYILRVERRLLRRGPARAVSRLHPHSSRVSFLARGSRWGMRDGYVCVCSRGQGHWDDEVIGYIVGSREEAWRVRRWLGTWTSPVVGVELQLFHDTLSSDTDSNLVSLLSLGS